MKIFQAINGIQRLRSKLYKSFKIFGRLKNVINSTSNQQSCLSLTALSNVSCQKISIESRNYLHTHLLAEKAALTSNKTFAVCLLIFNVFSEHTISEYALGGSDYLQQITNVDMSYFFHVWSEAGVEISPAEVLVPAWFVVTSHDKLQCWAPGWILPLVIIPSHTTALPVIRRGTGCFIVIIPSHTTALPVIPRATGCFISC